jgi:hypothetical protein
MRLALSLLGSLCAILLGDWLGQLLLASLKRGTSTPKAPLELAEQDELALPSTPM